MQTFKLDSTDMSSVAKRLRDQISKEIQDPTVVAQPSSIHSLPSLPSACHKLGDHGLSQHMLRQVHCPRFVDTTGKPNSISHTNEQSRLSPGLHSHD